jgi:HD superfamily phosphohydrolase YqeK
MKKVYKEIWKLARPFQDYRDDKGHAKITLSFALKLLQMEKARKDVVIPAIILHDIGWSQLSKKERFLIFDKTATKEDKEKVRIKHQQEGVKLAKKILQKVSYDKKLTKKILKIISQHDTGERFLSKEDGIVKDADKLWRFSKPGFNADFKRFKITPEQNYRMLKSCIDQKGFFFSELAKKIAKEELEKIKL